MTVTTTPDLERLPITEFIYQYKHKAFSESLADSILSFTTDEILGRGATGDSSTFRPDVRDVLICNIGEKFEQYNSLLTLISEVVFDFLSYKTNNSLVGIPQGFDVEVIQYLKYVPGGHYVPHIDKFYGVAGTHRDRVLTILLYLNDNYAGGRLEFPYLDLSIKPEKNSLIIFPSTWEYCHSVKPVTRGVRHSLVSWFLDPNIE